MSTKIRCACGHDTEDHHHDGRGSCFHCACPLWRADRDDTIAALREQVATLRERLVAALDAADRAVLWMTHKDGVWTPRTCRSLRDGPDTCDCGSDAVCDVYRDAARIARRAAKESA